MPLMSLATLAAYLRDLQSGEGGLGVSIATVAGTCEFEHDPNLCALRKAERQKDHGANKFSMSCRYNRSYHYRFTNPPKALLKAKLDNIAIVPASMLPFKKSLQELINALPQG